MPDRPAPSKNTAIGIGWLAEEHKAPLARIIPELDRRRALQAWAVRASSRSRDRQGAPGGLETYFKCNRKKIFPI
jgi:hypothetical protein